MKKISIRMRFEYDPSKTNASDVYYKILRAIMDNRNNFNITGILDIHYLDK